MGLFMLDKFFKKMNVYLELIQKRIKENRSDKVFLEGYRNYKKKNPYLFPEKLNNKRMILASKAILSKKDKENLAELNKQFNQTEWERWNDGKYSRINLKELTKSSKS